MIILVQPILNLCNIFAHLLVMRQVSAVDMVENILKTVTELHISTWEAW